MADLERFVDAQDEGGQFDEALREISSGRKRGHWIWYVFPQITGLGLSSMSRMYAIRDRDEADAYLRHPVLFPRLLTITSAAADQVRKGVPIETLMGSPIDATKLVSSMTLFRGVALRLHQATGDDRFDTFARFADEILAAGSRQGYPPCQESLAIERDRG